MLFATAELGRSKLRFGLLTMGAGLLVFVLLFQQSLLDAVLDGMAGAVKEQDGPVVVYSRDAKRNFGAGLIPEASAQTLAQVPGVAATGNIGVGMLSYQPPNAGKRVNVSVIGYEPGKPGTPSSVGTGTLPASPDEIVISAEGSEGRFELGDTLVFQPGDVPLKVVGLTEGALVNTGPAAWIPWETYDKLVRLAIPETKVVYPAALAVQPAEGVAEDQLIRDINAAAPELDAMGRVEAAESAPGRKPIQAAFLAVMILCYIVVSVVIGFFFLTMTLQKESSITLLRAVGADARYLISCLLMEVALVTGGGLVIGVVMLYLVRPIISASIIIDLEPAGIIFTAVPALAVALLGALPPIRRVLRADPFAVVSRPSLGGVG